jgi:hypothetical protein
MRWPLKEVVTNQDLAKISENALYNVPVSAETVRRLVHEVRRQRYIIAMAGGERRLEIMFRDDLAEGTICSW